MLVELDINVFRFGRIFALSVLAILPSTSNAQEVYWRGQGNCEKLLEQPVRTIPSGFSLSHRLPGGTAHYKLPGGGTLKLRLSEAHRVWVHGDSFNAAYKNLIEQDPLNRSDSGLAEDATVFANVETRYSLDLNFQWDNDRRFIQIRPDGYNVNMKSDVSVIQWSGYSAADAVSREKWDRLTCENYHHELGHVLIGAQIFAEAEPHWMDLRGASEDMISLRTDQLFDQTMEKVRARQKQYHDEIEGFGEALAYSRPYVELPFTWLD